MSNKISGVSLSPHLMYRDMDFDPESEVPWNSEQLIQDLGLGIILDAMAGDDREIRRISLRGLLMSMKNPEDIRFRQEVLKDCLENREAIRSILQVMRTSVKKAKEKLFWFSRNNPEFSLRDSVSMIRIYIAALTEIKEIAEKNYGEFNSTGFRNLFTVLREEFDDDYIQLLNEQLLNLTFPRGIKVSGSLGKENELTDFVLQKPDLPKGIRDRINVKREKSYTYVLPDRDDQGAQAMASMRERSVIGVANVLTNVGENVLNFIKTMTNEVSFFAGCINLYEILEKSGIAATFPDPKPLRENFIAFNGLCDLALSINLDGKAVSNSVAKGTQKLLVVTGANRGGKSTFLRSLGQAMLMMQAGMFVGASTFSASTSNGIFTHFKREEDREMKKGKFDEELSRMNEIVSHIRIGSFMLFNEAFASTNAREGSEIAKQITDALLEKDTRVVFVTHLYELAEMFTQLPDTKVRYLTAERLPDGTRTYRIVPGILTNTSYGDDIYDKIFGQDEESSMIPDANGKDYGEA